ncbi:hypothetical protein BC829DRAFT_96228 [Chytridium lagenaria]|nr:hypothetical protein BC829DRAFT_96228 [Chytridium lagenaria]
MINQSKRWPAVVEAKMDDTFTVSLNAIKMDGSEGIRMVADIRELRLSEDPRAWKWFSLRYIYFTAQTHNGNMAPYAAPTASINRACQSMEQNIKDRISPEGLVWTRAPKYTPRAAGEAVLSLIDRCRLVKRFDGDPKNDEVFTECIRIDNGEEEQGLLVEFGPEVKSARRVISAYPLLMADGKDGEESYVEIEIVSLGETDDGKAFVSIGLGLRPSPPFMMAGWMPNSVALHSFFGRRLREGRTDFPLRAQPFGAGDIVGIYFHRKGKIGFTLNGVSLDDEADSCIKQAYLVLSADGPCVMRVNAGQRPFICQGEAVFGEHSKTENRGDGGDGGEGKKANDAE